MEKLSERLPEVYQNQMKELLGDDYERYIEALNNDSVRGLRVNKVKVSVDEFLKSSEISKNAYVKASVFTKLFTYFAHAKKFSTGC